MKRFFLVLILLIPTLSFALEYQIDVELIPEENRLDGQVIISGIEQENGIFNLFLSEKCSVLAVYQDNKRIPFEFSQGRLSISLNNRTPVSISYKGHFSDKIDGVPEHNEDPSYGISAGITDQGTFLSSSSNWYPLPGKEIDRHLLSVTAPKGIEAVTSGKRLERKSGKNSVSSWFVDYPLRGLTLTAGKYLVFEDLSGDIPIYAYFYPKSVQLAEMYLQETRKYLTLYQDLFGPYPYHKFAVVENFFPTGYGFPSWTLLGSSVIRLPFIVKTSLGHEMAHSWWGTGVRVDYSQGNWSEGLATYVADYLYKEQESEPAAREYRLKILRDFKTLVNTDNQFPLSRFLSRDNKASQSIGYGKVAMIFHMLRKELGDEIFWKGLREIAQQSMFETIGWDHFQTKYSRLAHKDLSTFFSQWLQRAAGPYLALKDVELTRENQEFIIRGKLIQKEPFYDLTLQLYVELPHGNQTISLDSSSKVTDFVLRLDDKPVSLSADPDSDLFRLLADEEVPPTINAVRSSRNLLAVRTEQKRPSSKGIASLLAGLRKSHVTVKEEKLLSDQEFRSNDLLIFGMSDNLSPDKVESEKLIIAGEKAGIDEKSAFLVTRSPYNDDKVAAWFLSDDEVHDAAVARKIPHYGKYSYLVFNEDKNELKGTFRPRTSAMRVEF